MACSASGRSKSDVGSHFNAVRFQRTTVSQEDAIERSKEIYGPT
jgi:hypothetical protein